ncbi:MAG TPA: lactate utilization protein, partial [Ruminiclostridium sp.]|nr:lactate utilization protein [Ruminiclostridium sp.]
LKKAKELIKDGDTVSVGGSMTLFETGIIDYLKSGRFNYLDRYADGLAHEDREKIFRESFFADDYFTSSNVVTEEGELYNVDGSGNRVSAMIFGPKSVIVVVGYNKIVSDREAAIERVRKIAAPANAARLSCKTPCAKKGECMDCKTDARICCSYVFLGQQRENGRIKVIIAGEPLGY